VEKMKTEHKQGFVRRIVADEVIMRIQSFSSKVSLNDSFRGGA
jgi:hypothetical protein